MKDRTKRDIKLILTASFFYFASSMLVTPIITGFSKSVGAGALLMGMIGGLMNFCALLCRPFMGNLSDRISKYRLTFVGAVFMFLGCLGYLLAQSSWFVVLSRIINGIGFSCCSVCLSVWMSNLLPRDRIGSGMGIMGTMNALAMAIAPAIGISVYQVLGYRAAFAIATAFTLCDMIVIQFIYDKGKPESTASTAKSETGKKLQICDKKVVPVAAIIMLFAIPYCATQSFLVSYVEARNLNVTVGLFFPAYAVIIFVLRCTMKDLFDKLSFGSFLFMSSVSAFLGMLFLTIMKNNIEMLLAAAFMAGGYGIMYSVCQSTAILMAGEGKRGIANSTYYIGLDLGMTLGPLLGGFLYGKVSIQLFYPLLIGTILLSLIVYFISKASLNHTEMSR